MNIGQTAATMGTSFRFTGLTDRGSVTLWSLGLVIAVLFVGGIGLDLWRGVADRQRVAAIADAAASAGATAVAPGSIRGGGEVLLDEGFAQERAWASLAAQEEAGPVTGADVTVNDTQVTVTVSGQLDFTLLRVLYPAEALAFTVTGSSSPAVGEPG